MFTGDQKSSHGAFSSSDQKWHEDICNNERLLSEDYFLERVITIAPYLHYEQYTLTSVTLWRRKTYVLRMISMHL